MPASYVLTLACPDRPGLVFAVSSWIVDRGGNIEDSQQWSDPADQQFFLRLQFTLTDGTGLETLRQSFAGTAGTYSMWWRLVVADAPFRTLIMVSRYGHCLNDLLFRHSIGALNIEVPAIVSNHRDLERLAASYDVPFHHIAVTPQTKPDAEREMLELVGALDIDLVVLARYMQVLADSTCRALEGRAINIHHSFLPSFKGAKPYHQAHDRGVKLIGATAHYVTRDLDEGPIIDQDVTRVTHRMLPADLARAGRDIEAGVLSRAVELHSESRILLNGHRTVTFA